jgi:hypothetical protein
MSVILKNPVKGPAAWTGEDINEDTLFPGRNGFSAPDSRLPNISRHI